MKKIYIIISNSGTLVSKILKLFTKQKYVHVSIALDKNLKEAYSFGRKYVYSPIPGGFINEEYVKRCKHFNKSISKIYELEIDYKKYNNLKKELENKYKRYNKKYKYNYRGLYFIQFNKIHHRDYHYLCSQFCGKLLIDNKIMDFNKDYSLIKPKDFLDINYTNLIFEGKTIDYLKIRKRV